MMRSQLNIKMFPFTLYCFIFITLDFFIQFKNIQLIQTFLTLTLVLSLKRKKARC